MTDTPSLVPYDPNCTLHQVAARLSLLGERVLDEKAIPTSLAQELHVAALCCFQAHARWEDLLETLQNYRLERANLESWLDGEIAQLQREVAAPTNDLTRLRPDAAGAYAWDRWETQARAAGLDQDLATLGRAVMREAVQHAWEPALQAECGWSDAGQAMLALAQRDATSAQERWRHLLETDGLRGRFGANGEWQPL